MKKFLFLAIAGTFLCFGAQAGDKCDNCHGCYGKKAEQRGGFFDASIKPMGLAEVQKLSDDSRVVIEGYITKQISDDEYMFTDGTDTIRVEIDEKDWRGQRVTPKDKIIIRGDVDKDLTSFKVEAKSVTLVK